MHDFDLSNIYVETMDRNIFVNVGQNVTIIFKHDLAVVILQIN